VTTAAFDRVAPSYQTLWSGTPAGEMQREAVWRFVEPLFQPGSRVLDIGCGVGDDAATLQARGVHVTGIDASPEMVRIARERGVEASVRRAEDIDHLAGSFEPRPSAWRITAYCSRKVRRAAGSISIAAPFETAGGDDR
jgi:ubiquinone/menaquinone biosynthesis C-methylase UbiE